MFPEPPRRRPKIKISAQALAMNPSSQPYQPGELPPVPPAFPGDAAAASLTAEQVQALTATRADAVALGLSFYEYQIGKTSRGTATAARVRGSSPVEPDAEPAPVPRRPRPRGGRGERPGPRVRRLLRALPTASRRPAGPAVLGRARNLPDVRRRAPQGRRHNPMPEVSRGRDGRRQSEPRPHRRAPGEPPVVTSPFPTSLYILPGTSLVQFETARQERVHPRDLPHAR